MIENIKLSNIDPQRFVVRINMHEVLERFLLELDAASEGENYKVAVLQSGVEDKMTTSGDQDMSSKDEIPD